MPYFRGHRGYWTGHQTTHQGRGGQTQHPYNGGGRREGYSYAQVAAAPVPAQVGPDSTSAALASMANYMKDILQRLNVLEGRGPEKARSAPVGANSTPSGPRHPTDTFKSINVDFSAVCKNIYRSVQLEHHLGNWSKLPEKLDKRLQSFVTDIKPPMGDDALRNKLKKITEEYSNKLCDSVRHHLEEQSALNEVAASTLNKQDAERAIHVADRYISNRLRNKITQDRKEQLLKTAVGKIGTLPGQQATGPSTSSSSTQQQESHTRQGRVSQVGGSTRKQVKVQNPPQQVKCINKFEVLSNIIPDHDDCITVDEEDDDVETDGCDSPIVSHTPKRPRRTSNADVASPGKLHIHNGPKTYWKLQVSGKTRTLVLGDSNLRQVTRTDLPGDWEVHAFPGATFDHVTRMIQGDCGNVNLDNLVIQVGINHRDNHPQVTKQKLFQLENVICGLGIARKITFCGVTTPASLDADMKQRIKDLNTNVIALTRCGYLPPLPDERASSTRPQDPFDIHYNKETVEDLLASIHDHLN